MNRTTKWLAAAAVGSMGLMTLGRSLPATPAMTPELPAAVDLWIDGNDSVGTNIETSPGGGEALFSPAVAYYLSAEPPADGAGFVAYGFALPEPGKLGFFAALGHQGSDYVSPVEFRLDDRAWQAVTPSPAGRLPYGISGALGWEYLGEFELEAGNHRLEFRFDRPSNLGTYSFLCDGVAAVAVGEDQLPVLSGLNAPATALPGETLSLAWSQDRPGLIDVTLRFCDGTAILHGFAAAKAGLNRYDLNLPAELGASTYTVELQPLAGPLPEPVVTAFTIPWPDQPAARPRLTGATERADGGWRAEVEAPAEGRLLLWYFVDGVLYGAESVEIPQGASSVEGVFEPAIVNGRETSVRFLIPGGEGQAQEMRLARPGSAAELPKPINYGVFVDRLGQQHPWYMDHQSRYVYDGEVFTPFGAMWNPDTMFLFQADPAAVRAAFERDMAVLEAVNAHGLRDSYLNMSHVSPLWVRQFFLDELDRRGQTYGYQLTSVGNAQMPAFFLTHDREAGGGWQGMIRGRYRDGRLTARMPRSYELLGMLVFPADPAAGWCRMFSFQDREGRNTRHNIIDLERVQDFGDLREVGFAADLPLADGSEVLIMPMINAGMHHGDLWNPEVMAELKRNLAWVEDIQWGPGLRFFIDPVTNEGSMLNSTENLRQYTPGLHEAFAAWLEQRYRTPAALSAAWDVSVADFAAAARLVPQRLGDDLLLLDPESGLSRRCDWRFSQAWPDFCDMIRETYAEKMDEVALYLKSMVDVPVICKSVGVVGEKMNLSNTYRGVDSIGFEIYLNGGVNPGEVGGGASRAEAELSGHTMWKVGTELGHSFNVANDGVKFFTDEEEVRALTGKLAQLGVAGFYYFGWTLKPGDMWDNHNFQDFPQGLSWIGRIKAEWLDGSFHFPETPRYYAFPNGNSWWWWTTRNLAVYGFEASDLSQGARLAPESQEWFASVSEIPESFDGLLLSCPYPPFSHRYAEAIDRAVAGGAPVYYLGGRSDPGAIPAIDRYFTRETIAFADGSSAQVLNPGGAAVLAQENGRPWALRAGNLVIVSRVPRVESKVVSADDYLRYMAEIVAAQR